MSSDARQAVLTWLNNVGIRDPGNLDMSAYTQLRGLLSSNERPGFGVFMSLIMFERQQAVAQLIQVDLGSPENTARVAKLQGIVQCVDNIRELILNIADPIGEGSSSETEVAGVRFDGNGTAEQQPIS
jgi:hypothetical protein